MVPSGDEDEEAGNINRSAADGKSSGAALKAMRWWWRLCGRSEVVLYQTFVTHSRSAEVMHEFSIRIEEDMNTFNYCKSYPLKRILVTLIRNDTHKKAGHRNASPCASRVKRRGLYDAGDLQTRLHINAIKCRDTIKSWPNVGQSARSMKKFRFLPARCCSR